MSRIEYTPNPPPQSLTEKSSQDLALYLQNELAQISSFIGEITDVDTMSNPNLLINGDFREVLWQRGTSFAAAGDKYTADRWWCGNNISAAISGNVPTGFSKSITLTGSGGTQPKMNQGVELDGAGLAGIFSVGKTFTISGWVRASSSTPKIQLNTSFVDAVGSGTNAVVDFPLGDIHSIQADNVWEYFKHTFTVVAAPAGTNLAYSVAIRASVNDIVCRFTGLKLEAGNVATPYQARPIGEEFALCQRYGQTRSTNSVSAVDLRPSMRVTPAVTGSGPYFYNAEI